GPYWWEGPEFTKQHEIFEPKPQNRDGYSTNFFTWVHDFTGDGWNDLVSVGLPGSPAVLYVNPGKSVGEAPHWMTHKVFDGVGNESPQFVNLLGSEQPELVCNHSGKFGFATFDVTKPDQPWTWHAISENVGEYPFGHGLGVGDVNGDGRQDVIWKGGWYEQPKSVEDDPLWASHKYQFAGPGGADMFAYDVDGDGDNDVITSLAAHTYGLAWFEQVKDGDAITFQKHLIMGDKAEDNPYGVLFTEPHAVALVDMDGDGLKDIITGKTYWSHHRQSPMWDAGAVVYWFKLVRRGSPDPAGGKTEGLPKSEKGKKKTGDLRSGDVRGQETRAQQIDWVPYRADDESGIGRQLSVGDIDGDKLPDIVVGGMKGAHVLRHKVAKVNEQEFKAAQPKKVVAAAEGLSPQEAAAAMTVPDGFKVQLAAGEPLVHQPIAFTIDSRGRLWVAEAYTYPNRAKDGEGKDKIVILEDTDGDGTFEKRKVFIEGLNLVSGLELGFGGIWVGAAPYLMFIPDRDGDDVPDQSSPVAPRQESRSNKAASSTQAAPAKEANSPSALVSRSDTATLQFPKDVPPGATVLLDGFGWQDTHETLNAFIWGPDGWLYGCHGVFTHSKVGKPGTKDDDRLGLNAGVWRYHPTKHQFEVFASGTSNPWGVDFDDHGQAFITACVIPHLWHMIQGGRYHRQGGQHFNPYTFEDIKTIADHLHYVGRIQDHAWWGHEPHAPTDTLKAGGGHAHCGAMIYLGDNFPIDYRNQIFMDNVHGNRINVCRFDRSGSGFVGRRAPDFLIANDHWFRGINLKYGPDGSVYLIDWYDKNACHRTNPEIWDRTNGRIYNVKYGGVESRETRDKSQKKVTDLAKLSDAELVELHAHPNEWQVRMARRLLQERAEAVRHAPPNAGISATLVQTRPQLVDFINKATDVTRKLRGYWTLHAMFGPMGDEGHSMMKATGPDSEYLRAWRIQLVTQESDVAKDGLGGISWTRSVEMANSADEKPVVRLALASALQRIRLDQRWKIAEGLLSHAEDADDHNLPLMYWYGIEPLVVADPAKAIALAKASKIEKVSRFIVRRAASVNETTNAVVEWLASAGDAATQQMLLDEMRIALEGRVNVPQPAAWTPAYDKLLKSDDALVREKADGIAVAFGDKRILPRMRDVLADAKQSVEQRQRALDLLVKGRDTEAAPALRAALNDTTLRGPALRALAAFDDAATSPAILALYAKLNDAEKRDAINTLVARPGSANKLFDAIEKGDVPRTDVHAYHVQQLLGFKDDGLAKRITSVWGEIRATAKDKQELIVKHKAALTTARLKSADLSNGRRLYTKTCSACHILFGEGGKIGPDITGSNRANLDYILENVLDPSAIVGKDYRMTILALNDGRVVSGLILKETDSAVTVRTINDTVVVAKTDIDERKLSELSLMPEGQLNQLTPNEQRDLIAYIGTPNQVALRGPKAPLDAKTGKVADAL
ncbi:MAG: FG-GAP repeat protein, partial [Candidatus Saccharimonas sp.]|nr:FG-GAP repeat protein [Planctomycetaceae bacterium]